MGGGSSAKDHPWEYLAASAMAAAINYPLWRASAIGQSGFVVTTAAVSGGGNGMTSALLANSVRALPPSLSPYVYAFAPPYKGMVATVLGMTWARAAIFWGSDRGRDYLLANQIVSPQNEALAMVLPPLIVSTMVQCINMPLVRASITLQNPESNLPNTWEAMKHIYHKHNGFAALWHGTSAGILKTVPKYCTAIVIKDYMEKYLPPVDPSSPTYDRDRLWRSALKSATAGVAGAALTNPLDVIRNEMFKTNQPLLHTVQQLYREKGLSFVNRGMGKNMVAVAIPVGCTIFFTDALIHWTKGKHS